MNISVFNIHPNEIIIPKIINTIQYSFLDHLDIINIEPYYSLLNTIEDFRIKNVYHFLYLRSILINKKFHSFPTMNKNYEDFDETLKEYINNDLTKTIVIINGIQQYFIPRKH
tara:strand:+ start:971 stop:1309 length:339 start_codon:yes stop_codon:yes gene_type:complete